jgi:hypothetical protein
MESGKHFRITITRTSSKLGKKATRIRLQADRPCIRLSKGSLITSRLSIRFWK